MRATSWSSAVRSRRQGGQDRAGQLADGGDPVEVGQRLHGGPGQCVQQRAAWFIGRPRLLQGADLLRRPGRADLQDGAELGLGGERVGARLQAEEQPRGLPAGLGPLRAGASGQQFSRRDRVGQRPGDRPGLPRCVAAGDEAANCLRHWVARDSPPAW